MRFGAPFTVSHLQKYVPLLDINANPSVDSVILHPKFSQKPQLGSSHPIVRLFH